jgi:predicted hydrocarbon binding protein
MTSTIPTLTPRSVSVPASFFGALRASAAHNADPVTALRDAGYAAGVSLYDSFEQWLGDRGEASAELLADDHFGVLMAEFLTASGWGGLRVEQLSSAVVALDATDWAEVQPDGAAAGASCHAGTGLLAGFFGRVADAPLAVLEVECRSQGDARCRFLVGSVDVLQYVYEAMERGVPYDRAANSAATG